MTTHPATHRIIAFVAVTAVLTSALWLFASPPAAACSCEEMTNSAIEQSDAAFAGTIVAMASIPSRWEDQDRFVAKVQVTTDLKDNLADEIYLTSHVDDGGNCGVTWWTGHQIAAAIYADDGVLSSDSCSEIPPPLADSWQPATSIGGNATLLIGGYGPNRLVAYDRDGTPIAYAFEPGQLHAFSICPNATTVLEVVNHDSSTTIDTRSLATFEVTSSTPAILNDEPFGVWDVRCESPDGSSAAINGYENNAYRLSNGIFDESSEQFTADSFDPQNFWPRLETASTAPIVGEAWMEQAAELEAPVMIAASDRSTPITQLGSGESFGLDEDAQQDVTQDDVAQDESAQGEPLVRQDPGADEGVPGWIWVLAALGAVFGIAYVVSHAKRD